MTHSPVLRTYPSLERFLLFIALAFFVIASQSAVAQNYTFQLLYAFTGSPDGSSPQAALVSRNSSLAYGTTAEGGNPAIDFYGYGTVFTLDATGHETVLYLFCSLPNCTDGAIPTGNPIMDAAGNLYGTTVTGGAFGGGVVYKIDPAGQEAVLYSFASWNGDGFAPDGGVIEDGEGNLYGTTSANTGKGCACGAVFKLDSTGKETLLYSFEGGTDGAFPVGGLVRDDEGNLYGTTSGGGTSQPECNNGCGTIFKIDTSGNETVLHRFAASGMEGINPEASLIRDKENNLYGTTIYGGVAISGRNGNRTRGSGTIFELQANGTFTVLHQFKGYPADGANPVSALVAGADGTMYGSTEWGGSLTKCVGGCGAVYRISNHADYSLLYSFCPEDCSGGAVPMGSLILDASGALYGTLSSGGLTEAACAGEACGTVFKLIP
jgi:uncharacterized repeat protein (TIGR03803 family)